MRRWGSLLATSVLVALGLVLVGPAPAAHACSCAFGTEHDQFEFADLVVEGTVTTVEPANLDRFADARVTVAVDRVLKGPARDTVAIGASLRQSDASCRYAFAAGLRYRVYARQPAAPIAADGVTSLCSGNHELERRTTPPVAAPQPPADDPYGHADERRTDIDGWAGGEWRALVTPIATPDRTAAAAAPRKPADDPHPFGPVLALGVATLATAGLAAAVVIRRRRAQ